MTIQSDLFAALGQYAGLSALVGTRIYPDVAPEDVVRPYVVWQEVATVPVNGIDGHHSLNNYRIQIVSLDTTALRARAVAVQVRAAMAAAIAFKSIEVDFGTADFEVGSKVFGMRSDFSVWYRN
jgi:hypothetical protein